VDESRQTKDLHARAMVQLKRAIAEEMGVWETVKTHGWGILSAKDCGRIGGKMASHLSPNMLYKLATAEGAVDTDLESES